jgi:peptide/nickel transport system permease protein
MSTVTGEQAPRGVRGAPPVDTEPQRGRSTAIWAVKRVVGAVVVLWATATITFAVQAGTQTNRAISIYEQESGTTTPPPKSALAAVDKEYGFSQSALHQYLTYIGGLTHADLGTSYLQHEPVLSVIGDQIVPTLLLTGCSLVLAWIIAVAVTVLTSGRTSAWSWLGSGFQIVSASLPTYWLGTILVVIFGLDLRIFPVESGSSAIGLVLPTITLALPVSGFMGQVMQDEFKAVLERPFVTSSRSRGVTELGVRVRHVLRHATLPALTLSGWAVGYLFSGAVLVETVFARPGIGSVLVTATGDGDVPVVAGVVLTSAAIYIVANLVVDILYRVVDPRIKNA